MPLYQVYLFWPAYSLYIKFLFAELILSHSSASSGTCFEPNCNAEITGPIITWLTQRLLIYVPIQPFKSRSFTCLTEPLPNKQYCLIASSQRKDYLQINAFLASAAKVERNLEAPQMKATATLGGAEIRKTFSFIESLGKSHCAEQWRERWLTKRTKAGFLKHQHKLTHWFSAAEVG